MPEKEDHGHHHITTNDIWNRDLVTYQLSEGQACHHREIQSAYFGHSTFSIFRVCCYVKGEYVKLVNKTVVVISEASDHSHIAAFTCLNKVLNFMHEKYNLQLCITLHVWSDGCSAQFQSRLVFRLLYDLDCSITLR